MKASIAAFFALAVPVTEGATQFGRSQRTASIGDDSKADQSPGCSVPGYNFTMPVDHFTSSNKHTYSNRFFVNDTYYKSGGPVILFDNGEAGFDPGTVSDMLAEASGQSLPMRLAANLSGIVVGWEHRYYGYSRPVPLDDESGFPVEGVKGYKYLSANQALADVAFFANDFNKTKLDSNTNVKSTVGLDPYNTPWIFVGGSYPGARAAWMRYKYPEIIYASWASSAPLQYQSDGFPYYNPIMRSMATNCTNDLDAAIKYVDRIFDSGSPDEIALIKAAVYLTGGDASLDTIPDPGASSSFDTAMGLAHNFTLGDGYQGYGPYNTTQAMCDFMQSFDMDEYSRTIKNASDIRSQGAAMIKNKGGKTPTSKGIAAGNGDKGGQYAFAALIYGIKNANEVFQGFQESIATSGPGSDAFTPNVDDSSWNWQTISETGTFQGSNTNNITCISRRYNVTAVHNIEYIQQDFDAFDPADMPKQINNEGLLDMGGWDMTVSNTMFTNGEIDPWRAFSVASQEVNGPNRKIVQKIPGCNKAPSKDEAFGITYLGAVHVEDLQQNSYSGATYVNGQSPLHQGLDLFLRAWDVWQPCFNQSRDTVRNGNGTIGKGHGPNGTPGSSIAHKAYISFTTYILSLFVAVVVL